MINDPGVNALDGVVGCGARLQQARAAAGLSLEEAAAKVHMPLQVVRALEAEDWARLGAPVFVRGQLRSYARLLKVDLEPLLEQARLVEVQPAALVSHTHTPPMRRLAESLGRRAMYVVITAVLAVPVWFASRGVFDEAPPSTASLDVLPAAMPASASDDAAGSAVATEVKAASQKAAPVATPYIASIAAVPRQVSPRGIGLSFSGDSWVEITGPGGVIVERALIKAGENRAFKAGEVARMKLGNATAVELSQAGTVVDLAPYRSRANVAHFAVSSDGSVTPVSP